MSARVSRVLCCLSRAPTIVALGLLAEPREEGLAVGKSQYRGAGLCHGVQVLGGVPLALQDTISQHSSRWCLVTGAQSFR